MQASPVFITVTCSMFGRSMPWFFKISTIGGSILHNILQKTLHSCQLFSSLCCPHCCFIFFLLFVIYFSKWHLVISKAILFLLLITLKNINCSHLGLKTSKEHCMTRTSPNFFVLVVMYKEDNRVLFFYVIHTCKTSISQEAIFYANYKLL